MKSVETVGAMLLRSRKVAKAKKGARKAVEGLGVKRCKMKAIGRRRGRSGSTKSASCALSVKWRTELAN